MARAGKLLDGGARAQALKKKDKIIYSRGPASNSDNRSPIPCNGEN